MKKNIPEAIGIVISLAGVTVIVGWYLNIGALKSVLPFWVSMKFSTALSFLLSGIALCFLARFKKQNYDLAFLILAITSMMILLLMVSLLASTIIGMSVGVEEFFIKDSERAVESAVPGMPSVVTMINFILIALAGIVVSVWPSTHSKVLIAIGLVVGLTGIIAVFGYIFNQPRLYFFVHGKSSAMAIHTAILFVLWSWGVILIGRYK